MLLRNSNALSSATAWHIVIERYLKQHNNQDYVLNLEDTQPSIVSDPSREGHYTARKSGLRFFEAYSSFIIQALRPQKLDTINVECADPNNYLFPHARELTLSTCDGTVLHAVDLVWTKSTERL